MTPDQAEASERDARRYRWLRDRLAIEDVERYASEVPLSVTVDEQESLKTDAAIDSILAKGDA